MRVVIVGGGYAGYALALRIDPYLDVTLIDARAAFVHNVAAIRAVTDPGILADIVLPYAGLLRRGRFVHGRATAITESHVCLEGGEIVPADVIVVATGSRYAAPFKPQDDDVGGFSSRLLKVAEQLASADRVVIAGAGAVGVELAGEIRAVFPAKPVTLVSSSPVLFPGYQRAVHAGLMRRLQRAGVEVRLGDTVPEASAREAPWLGEVTLQGGAHYAGLIFPVTGARIADSPAHALPGVERRSSGQIGVDGWLRPSRHANVFALGDLVDTGDTMTVVSTLRQAPFLARLLRQLAEGARVETLQRYRPWPIAPILLPLGPRRGLSVLPLTKSGLVVGDTPTAMLKGRSLFIPRYRKEFGLA